MKKRKIIIAIWIMWMVLIYWLSAQPDTVSSEQSMGVGELICSIVVNGFREMEELKRMQYVEMIDHFVRKSAHFCEYMILGSLTCSVFRKTVWIQKYAKIVVAALLWCGLYAMSDEIHQLFVPGRYGSALDVLLDTAGSFMGILITVWIMNIRKSNTTKL